MHEHLFGHVNIDPRNTHLPDGRAADTAAACAAYERRIRECGGIDLQLLGLGREGHIGFNEPLSALRSRTREKALTPGTRVANAALFGGDPERVPPRAITMGVGTILECRHCLMLVTGRAKADILARAVEGPITAMVSASALQLHPHCRVIVDEEAAVRLHGIAYYRWIFENEPEWAEFRERA
jgi:glucosamine-6-phosphate deaminase